MGCGGMEVPRGETFENVKKCPASLMPIFAYFRRVRWSIATEVQEVYLKSVGTTEGTK